MTVLPGTFREQLVRSAGAVPPWGFDAVRVVLGCILLTAAALKGWQLATEPLANDSIFSYRWSLMAQVEVEFFLALWLLSGVYPRQVWWAALAGFAFFACVTLYKGLSGAASCGCFGRVEVSPWYTLVLDLAAVAALLLFRPVVQADRRTRAVRMRMVVATLLLLAIGIPGGVAMAGYQPAALPNDGQTLGKGKFVLLEPETWVGKPLPLLEYIDIGDRLLRGKWVVLLHRHDCSKCHSVLPAYGRLAAEPAAQPNGAFVALVEIPPFEGEEVNAGIPPSVVSGRLSSGRQWFVTTPVGMLICDGIVQSIWSEDLPAALECRAMQ